MKMILSLSLPQSLQGRGSRQEVEAVVLNIISNVQARGDAALLEYTEV
jgi:histidinol dehydrogenase